MIGKCRSTVQSGFTLVEIVVVIAIIGILAAIAVPNMIGWVPKYRLQNAANDLRSDMQKLRMSAIRNRMEMAAYFDPGTDSYQIVEAGPDRVIDTPDDLISRSINLADYRSGVSFGRGRAGGTDTDDDLGPIAGNVSYRNFRVVFTPAGLLRNDSDFSSGYVYLTNSNNDAFAVGTPSLAGIVRLRIWDGGSWTQ